MPDQPETPQQPRIKVRVQDHTGNKAREVRIVANADVGQLMPALIHALHLPVTDPTGRPVTYHLAFNDRQIQREETLEAAGVEEGATLNIVPEMTAGSHGRGHGYCA